VAALGRGEGDDVAHIGVVDRVLDPVGEHRVAVGHVEGDVELEPLPDLLLGVADPVVGVDRKAMQLDLDPRLDPVVVRLHGERTYPSTASATLSACKVSATSCTRSTSAPSATASTEEAIEP